MESLDSKTFKALNADDGGTYSPASVITIGGSGAQMKLVGISTVENSAEFHWRSGTYGIVDSGANFGSSTGSTVSFAGQFSLSAVSNSDWFGPITIRADSGLASLTAQPGVPVQIDGFLTVGSGGTAHFATGSTTTVDGTINFNNAVVFAGISGVAFTTPTFFTASARISGGAQLKSPMTTSDTGRVVKRPPLVISTTGSNITGFGPANIDTVLVRDLSGPVSIYVQLGQDGDEFTVINKSSSHILEVHDANTGFYVAGLRNTTGSDRSITLVQIAGAWESLRGELVT